MRTPATLSSARGFTLVEMMVAMTLSLILLGGVLSVLYSSKVTYNENERVARLQESMRAGVEIILHDLRATGFPGCSKPLDPTNDFVSVLTNPGSLLWNFSVPVQGFDAKTSSTWSPALQAPLNTAGVLAGNDVIVVRTVRSNARTYRLNKSMTGVADTIEVQKIKGETLRARIPMLISDCNYAAVFAPSAVANGEETATLSHDVIAATATLPGNTSSEIGVFRATGNAVATIAPVDTIIYYIAASAAQDINGVSRGPALWRISATEPSAGTDPPGTPQEVVEGVEALQVRYGVDTTNDMLVDNYVTADAVTDWNDVISISIAAVVRSPEEINPEKHPAQTFQLFPGETYTSPSDRRARALFNTTVTLRNRTT